MESKRKAPNLFEIQGFLLWCHQESNRGHKDFQSFALPTELWHHLGFADAKVRTKFDMTKYFQGKMIIFIFKFSIYN